ncbi:MAG TPA: hypothetical protein DCE48_01360 [Lachnospiraceae bacterium]|uniref:hypothetical protein n=1 Tax=Anaerosporobacter sp. TaxID=1872529 RepID=UPI000ED0707A|nr:hypothetical protein [Anaerosporobacter sp.]HAB59359.1 hypothetical protein [Lachnospiraceae bacterium]
MGEALLVRKGGGVDVSDSTATSADIIQGKKAYIDDSGEAKAGTIPLNSGQISGTNHMECDENVVVGNHSLDNKQRLYIRPTAQATARQAYEADSWFTKETSKLAPHLGITADKIVKGNTICGVTGTADTSGGITNFPLTISTAQPSPIDIGHIWINTARVSNPNCYISPSILSGFPDNSVIFVVGDMSTMYSWSANRANGYYTELNNINSDRGWRAGVKVGAYETWFKSPMVYTKVNGTIYIETAYMWDGTKWLNISTADKYVFSQLANSTYGVYNVIDHKLYKKEIGVTAYGGANVSKNGQFILTGSSNLMARGLNILKRTGDTFTVFQSISNAALNAYAMAVSGLTDTVMYFLNVKNASAFSQDGNYMILVAHDANNTSTQNMYIFRFKLNSAGTAFDLIGTQRLTDAYPSSTGTTGYVLKVLSNSDLSRVLIQYSSTSSSYLYVNVFYGSVQNGYTRMASNNTNTSMSGLWAKGSMSPNGKYAIIACGSFSRIFYLDTSKVYEYSYQTYPPDDAVCVNDDGELITSKIGNTVNFNIRQKQITFDGSTVSWTNVPNSATISSFSSSISNADYNGVCNIVFTKDQTNAYVLFGSGGSLSQFNNSAILKLNFSSSGALSSVTELGATLGANVQPDDSYLIGY